MKCSRQLKTWRKACRKETKATPAYLAALRLMGNIQAYEVSGVMEQLTMSRELNAAHTAGLFRPQDNTRAESWEPRPYTDRLLQSERLSFFFHRKDEKVVLTVRGHTSQSDTPLFTYEFCFDDEGKCVDSTGALDSNSIRAKDRTLWGCLPLSASKMRGCVGFGNRRKGRESVHQDQRSGRTPLQELIMLDGDEMGSNLVSEYLGYRGP